ncbi:hypothetical protein BDV93DRAFT_230849 [Ceratobasidium sp. AG-I]|nr:hypothetical protein BDV93DRAFT_230849 [Ceratobasidium sp. AG-I]
MFILQDCSICFEDYGALRIPHSISCGHVFCHPCLDSLVTSSPNCPNCRALFGRKSIRKVVCTFQDPPTLDASTLSEAEMMMWQEIESAVESEDAHEQRRSLIRDNSTIVVQQAGFSKNVLVALDVMRLLVQVESTNRSMSATYAVEESLRDRITFLEARLNGTRATFSANVQDVQIFLSKMQQLEYLMRATDETTPQTTDQSLPVLADTRHSPPDDVYLPSSQAQKPKPPQPSHKPSQKAWSTESQLQWPSLPAATLSSGSPPSPPVAGSSYLPDTPRTHGSTQLNPAAPVDTITQNQPASASSKDVSKKKSKSRTVSSQAQSAVVNHQPTSSRSLPLAAAQSSSGRPGAAGSPSNPGWGWQEYNPAQPHPPSTPPANTTSPQPSPDPHPHTAQAAATTTAPAAPEPEDDGFTAIPNRRGHSYGYRGYSGGERGSRGRGRGRGGGYRGRGGYRGVGGEGREGREGEAGGGYRESGGYRGGWW